MIDPHISTTSETPDTGRLITIDEVSEHLRISRWSVYQLINNRRLKTITIGTRRLVAPEDLHKLVDDLREEGATHER